MDGQALLDHFPDDPVHLTQVLVRIDSSNPRLGSIPGPGESAVAKYISSWLEHHGIETSWIEPTKGRPSIVGIARGTGGGKSLMLNGHIDTVTTLGYDGDPLSGHIKNGKLFGRGSADMKSGIAAAMVALSRIKDMRFRGDVIFAGVADEEGNSIGTEQVLESGWRPDAAIVSEPTNLDIVYAHRGFVYAEIGIHGVAAHGSRADLGVDAICKAGHFLVLLDKLAGVLKQRITDPNIGPPGTHASTIKGGEEICSYPASCTISLEWRTVPGESLVTVEKELRGLLDSLRESDPEFNYDLRITSARAPFLISKDNPFIALVGRHVSTSLKHKPVFRSEKYWTDCALLTEAGIPSLLWGPRGEGLHSREEWVDTESITVLSDTFVNIAKDFCS